MSNHLTECPHCGGGIRFVDRRQNNTNGHHNCVYECGECGREVDRRMSDRTHISDYAQLGHRVDLSGVEKDRIVEELNESGGPVLVVENWLVDEKSIVAMGGLWKVYRVSILRQTDKAWYVQTGEERDWIPKSQSEVFVRDPTVEEIATPSSTLADFGRSA